MWFHTCVSRGLSCFFSAAVVKVEGDLEVSECTASEDAVKFVTLKVRSDFKWEYCRAGAGECRELDVEVDIIFRLEGTATGKPCSWVVGGPILPLTRKFHGADNIAAGSGVKEDLEVFVGEAGTEGVGSIAEIL